MLAFVQTSVLDEERLIAEEMKIKYEAIMQTQKSDNVALGRKLADLSDVQDSLRRFGSVVPTCVQ